MLCHFELCLRHTYVHTPPAKLIDAMVGENEPGKGQIPDCSWQQALNVDAALPMPTDRLNLSKQPHRNDVKDDDDDVDGIVPADGAFQSQAHSAYGRGCAEGCKPGNAARSAAEPALRADIMPGLELLPRSGHSLTPSRRRHEPLKSLRMVGDAAKRLRFDGVSVGPSVMPLPTHSWRSALSSRNAAQPFVDVSRTSAANSDNVDDTGDDNVAEEASADEAGESSLLSIPNLPRPTWCQVSQAGDNAPKILAGHAAVSHSGFLFIFGGFDGAAMGGMEELQLPHSNALYQFHPESNEWVTLSPNREHDPERRAPCARRHASLVIEGGSLFVYGGFNGRCETLGDLWEFQIDTRLWVRVQPSRRRLVSTSNPLNEAPGGQSVEVVKVNAFGTDCVFEVPSPRAEHTAVVFNNHAGRQMLVFAGYDGKKKLNDLYVFNFDSREWYRPHNASSNAPNRRCKHSAVLHDGKVWVTAGFQYCRGENYADTDMHCLDLESFRWSTILMDARCPEALQGHKAVVTGDFMYVIGGKVRGDGQSASDGHSSGLNPSVWAYHFGANRWTVLETNGRKPPPRQMHIAVGAQCNGGPASILICGGADKSRQAYFSDVWELRGLPSPRRIASDCSFCRMTSGMLNNPLFSDVTFVVEGQKLHAHRAILYSRCEYFRCMFEGGMREATTKEIDVPGLKRDVFLRVLEHLYTGNVTLTDGSLAVGLLQAADMFGLDELREQCVEKVERALTVENAAFVCQVADEANAFRLKHCCISFILHNFRNVIKTDAWASLMGADLGREILQAYADCCTFDPSAFRNRVRPG